MSEPDEPSEALPVQSLRRLARSLLYDRHKAEDVVQEAWLAVLRRDRAPRDLGSWLGGTVRRLAMSSRRAEARRLEHERRSARTETLPGADELTARLEVLRRILDAVDRLDEPYRAVIGPRFFEELPPRAISRKLGVPVETVRTRIRRGLQRLRRDLDGDDGRGREGLLAALVPFAGRVPWRLVVGPGSAATSPSWKGGLPTLGKALLVVLALSVLGASWILTRPPRTHEMWVQDTWGRGYKVVVPTADTGGGQQRILVEPRAEALEASWTLRGYCARGSEAPYAGAHLVGRVYAGLGPSWPLPQGSPLLEQYFDADAFGDFAWSIAPPTQPVTIVVEPAMADHVHWRAVDVFLPGDPAPENWELLAFPLDATVCGTVRDGAGTPLADVRVFQRIYYREDHETTTDAQGRYSLTCSSEWSSDLRLAASGFSPRTIDLGIIAPGGTIERDVALVPELRVHGHVVDEDGHVVAGAEVSTTYDFREYAATTDADGCFEVGGVGSTAVSNLSLYARKDGYAPSQPRFRLTEQPWNEHELEIVLETGARISGRVVTVSGEPIEGVWVSLGSPYALFRNEAWTDAEGRYTLEHAATGAHPLWFWRMGFAQLRHDLEIPREGLDGLEITLPEGHHLGGIVLGADGEPLARVRVNAEDWLHRNRYVDGFSTITGRDGRFRIEGLPDAGLKLTVHADTYARFEQVVDELDRDDLVLQPEGASSLAGIVVDAASGSPITSFTVRAHPLEADPLGGGAWFSGVPFHDPGGRWQLEGLPAGRRVAVEVSAPDHAAAVVEVVSGEPADTNVFRLHSGAAVRGRVIDRATGLPVSGVRVERRTLPNGLVPAPVEDTTDAEGRFELLHVPAGRMTLGVGSGSASAIDGPFEIEGEVPVERSIELGPSSSIAGRLLDAEGGGIAGQTIRLFGVDVVANENDWHTTTDTEGSFRLDDLPGGIFQLSWTRERGDQELADLLQLVHLESGETREIDLQPRGQTTLLGTVLYTGELPEVVPVVLSPLGGVGLWGDGTRGAFAEDGHFEVTNLEPGPWWILANVCLPDGSRRFGVVRSLEVPESGTIEVEVPVEEPR